MMTSRKNSNNSAIRDEPSCIHGDGEMGSATEMTMSVDSIVASECRRDDANDEGRDFGSVHGHGDDVTVLIARCSVDVYVCASGGGAMRAASLSSSKHPWSFVFASDSTHDDHDDGVIV